MEILGSSVEPIPPELFTPAHRPGTVRIGTHGGSFHPEQVAPGGLDLLDEQSAWIHRVHRRSVAANGEGVLPKWLLPALLAWIALVEAVRFLRLGRGGHRLSRSNGSRETEGTGKPIPPQV